MTRSSFYYAAIDEADDGVRAAVVKIAAEFPRFGYRMIRGELRRRGFDVNAKRVRRLMREEDLVIPVRRFVATSEYHPNRGDWPNRVKNRTIATLNDVWAADITSIDLGREFVYLAVIIDLHSRAIRGWWLDRDRSSALTHRALDRALAKHGAPKIHTAITACSTWRRVTWRSCSNTASRSVRRRRGSRCRTAPANASCGR